MADIIYKNTMQLDASTDMNDSDYVAKIESGLTDKRVSAADLKRYFNNVGTITCSSAAGSAKTISLALHKTNVTGERITLLMTNANTMASPTLQVGSGAAAPIYYNGAIASSTNTWGAGELVDVVFDGTNWRATRFEVSKTILGLGNVDNTSDVNKPVSTAQQTALNLKQDTSNRVSTFQATPDDVHYPTEKLVKDNLDAKADKIGYYPTLSVGISDNLKTTDGVEQAGQRFLYRATADDTTGAGAVSVSDGNAQLRLVSGHTVKQLVDGSFASASGWDIYAGSTATFAGGVCAVVNNAYAAGVNRGISGALWTYQTGHIYYATSDIKAGNTTNYIGFGCASFAGGLVYSATGTTNWQRVGKIFKADATKITQLTAYLDSTTIGALNFSIKNVMLFDLTEMGLAATLTTVAQCEAYFGSAYIPKGVQHVTATKLKSVGFNAFNPANVLAGYKVNEDGTLSAASGYSVVWVKILKSVTSGSTPNNGYVLYEKGGTGLVNAGFMPYEPTAAGLPASTVEGVTTISANPYIYTSNTINGWLVATVTNVAGLCVHLRWTDASYDAIYKAYSAYELTLPALSKSYLGGIVRQTGTSTFVEVADELNFVGKKMTERIGRFNLKDYVSGFTLLTYAWKAFVNGATTIYKSLWDTVHVAADRYSTQLTVESSTETTLVIAGVTYTRTSASDVAVIAFVNSSLVSAAGILEQPIGYSFLPNLFMNGYLRARGYYETASYHSSAQLVSQTTGAIHFQDTSCASLADFKAKVSAMTDAEATVYYIKATETVTAMSSSQSDTYEVSDYGTEEWLNNSVMPYTSTHYYMRNLKDELRNHLDGHDATWEKLSNKVSTSGWERIGTSSNDELYPSAGVIKQLLQVGTSSPTTATVGYVGSLFVDTAARALWVCTAVTTAESVTTYTWAKLA